MGIDHDVAAQLPDVFATFAGNATAENVTKISHDSHRTGQSPPTRFLHRVVAIQIKVRIQQQRPIQTKFAAVGASHFSAIECHDFDIGILLQLRFELTQLREVATARRSAKMPVKQQHQPTATTVLKLMNVALGIGKLKGDSRLTIHSKAFCFTSVLFYKNDNFDHSILPQSPTGANRLQLPAFRAYRLPQTLSGSSEISVACGQSSWDSLNFQIAISAVSKGTLDSVTLANLVRLRSGTRLIEIQTTATFAPFFASPRSIAQSQRRGSVVKHRRQRQRTQISAASTSVAVR